MSELSVFNFDSQSLRTITRNGEPWFVAADVCDTLGLDDTSKACSRLDDDEKGTNSIRTLGGQQEVTIINESGLYSLILTSRKPEAKRFKKWVTSEVLPTIRKTGGYASESTWLKDQLLTAKDQIIDLQRQILLSMQEQKNNAAKEYKAVIEYQNKRTSKHEKILSMLSRGEQTPMWKVTKALRTNLKHVQQLLDDLTSDGKITVITEKPAVGKTLRRVALV